MKARRIELGVAALRPWQPTDAASVARHANDRRIWRNVRDRFPHPYTLADADAFLARVCAMQPRTGFAIEVDGEAVGGIGLEPGSDVERRSAEIGFWLGTAFWGRGIMTAAVVATTEHAYQCFDLCRIHAIVFAWNPASMRVLEKAGYQREGVLRKSVSKDDQVIDSVLYAHLR